MRCYICGSVNDPDTEHCSECQTRLVSPDALVVPSALRIHNAVQASAGEPRHIATALVSAAADPELSDVSVDFDDGSAGEPEAFDFDLLFASSDAPSSRIDETDEEDGVDTDDADETNLDADARRRIFAPSDGESDRLRTIGLIAAVTAGLVFVGILANQRSPVTEEPTTVAQQPGFPTTAERSADELDELLAPVVFDLPRNECTTGQPRAIAISRQELITTGSNVDPGQSVEIVFDGTEMTGSVIGGTRSPDLAVIALDERLDIEEIAIPPPAGQLEVQAAEQVAVHDGSVSMLDVSDGVDGWAGSRQGLLVDAEESASFGFMPSGRLLGPVADRGDDIVVITPAAVRSGLERIRRGGETFGCSAEMKAAARIPFTDFRFGLDRVKRGEDHVLDPLADACERKDWQACDDLRSVSAALTEHAVVANDCGGHVTPSPGFESCVAEKNVLGGPPPQEPFVGACLALPRATRSEAVIVDCFTPHDAEVVATATNKKACAEQAKAVAERNYWDRPMSSGSIAVSGADNPACFVYDPGFDLESPLPEA